MTAQELQQISQTRIDEAKALISAGFYDGARYLAGYAVETALKAIICKSLGLAAYPPSNVDTIKRAYQTHKLDDLVLLAGLSSEFNQKQMDPATNLPTDFGVNWSEVSQWNEARRYDAIGTGTATAAANLINALEDPANGILTWLKTKW